ncbi:hypothetical protein M0208_10460 [Sphingomonas sp. SUN019]|uniref:hypothetical protein n=1 Tax=Sphingomonas sp. SUN019 TaxID=2937788 RepID=UPI0021642F81|nr:hypothetical protein [Sphingomonas sp. SUN019]UVO50916.1 hypothetical protein M0208_10460 [Sphingomonas sp. SUN019]
MADRSGLSQRSVVEWGVRGLLAVAFAVLGYFAVTGALARVLRSTDPARAHGLAPGDARINATFAQRLVVDPQASAADRQRADTLARTALRTDPTTVLAASALGIDTQARGDTAAARRLFIYAQRLSRRELVVQLWAIEDAVGRGDITGAIRQYDIALRTSRTAADVLFPILAAAIADPAIQKALTRTLAAKPTWADSFINYVGTQGPDVEATASLFSRLHHASVPVSGMAQGAVINALIQKGQIDRAWSYYARMRRSADRQRSRDPRFAAVLDAPSPLDWNVVDVAGGSTSIQRSAAGSFFDFAVSPTVGGALLQQVQLLLPGSYRLSGHSMNLDQPRESLPYWTLVCSGGRELGRVDMPRSAQADGVFAGRFYVPAGCPVQVLTLFARPSSATSGVSGQIDRVQLAPLP